MVDSVSRSHFARSAVDQLEGICQFYGVGKKPFEILLQVVVREGQVGSESILEDRWLHCREDMADSDLLVNNPI